MIRSHNHLFQIIVSVLTFLGVTAIFLFLETTSLFASEGRSLLRNTRGGISTCLALSVEVETNEFQVLVTCRGLVYPPEPPDLTKYVVWAQGRDTEDPERITSLTYGKGQGEVESKFDRIFVTLEEDTDPRSPEGPTVMEGTISNFNFESIADPGTIEPTPAIDNVDIGETNTDQQSQDQSPQEGQQQGEQQDPSFWQSTFGKIIIIVTAGFIIFIVIIVIYSRRS